MDDARSFALKEWCKSLYKRSATFKTENTPRNAYLWSLVTQSEASPACGNNPVRHTLLRPRLDSLADLRFVVGYDPRLDALMIILLCDFPDRWARLVCRRIRGCCIADCVCKRSARADWEADQFTDAHGLGVGWSPVRTATRILDIAMLQDPSLSLGIYLLAQD